jgi:type 2 lantibiotic biosynthesis protein LanM
MKTAREVLIDAATPRQAGSMSRLARVIAAGAPSPERVSSEFFVSDASDTRDTVPRLRRWLRNVAQDGEALRFIMEHHVASGKPLGSGFRPVRLRDPRHLPPWAESLAAFLAAQPVSSDEASIGGDSATPLASFERAAREFVPRRDGAIAGIRVSDAGYDGIIGGLVSRLIEVCDPVMRLETHLMMGGTNPRDWLKTPEIDTTWAGWLGRLEGLPGLAYVLGVACEQWRDSTVEIFERLRSDIPLLRRELFDGEEPGPVVEFAAGAGDRHADGRSVALLRFASGRGLVYKPKDLRHVEATMDIIKSLNGAGLALPLATRVVLCRDGYGWEERIDPAPVADRSGFHRFYRRLGMLIRLMQLLSGRDLWADNLLAVGDQPQLIDLECLFHPPLKAPPLLSRCRQRLFDRMQTTVVPTAMPLQASLRTVECPTRDVGCLSHATDPLESGGGALPIAEYRPWSRAELADPWNHADDVSDGYREMHKALLATRDTITLDGGPLHAFAGLRMRYIWRSTWDCHRIVRASVSPTALIDGIARETALAPVLRFAYSPIVREADRPDLCEIADAEIDAFRRLDVPLFTSITTSSSLFTPTGEEIAGHFAGTAWDEVRSRVAMLDQVSVESDVAILRSAIDAARGGLELALGRHSLGSPSASRAGDRDRPEDVDVSADEVVEAVHDIARLLCDARRPPLGTGDGWLALLWSPVVDMWEVGPATADLISGGLGPALFLAEHFSLCGDPRSWTVSRETLAELFEHSSSSPRDPRLGADATVPGGLAGPGSLIYAAARAGGSLGDATLFDAARREVDRAAAAVGARRVGLDLAFGLAGLQLELLRLRTDDAVVGADLDPLLAKLADRLGGAILDPGEMPDSEPSASRLSHLVPVKRDGVALALASSLAVVPELVANRTEVTAALAAYPFDLGQRGGRLAAMAVHATGMADVAPLTDLRSRMIELSRLSTRALLARAEEAQFAARVTNDPGIAIEARRCVRVLLDRRAASGRWFPDRLVDDRLNLSALDGVPALGAVLLRHIWPELPLTSVLG